MKLPQFMRWINFEIQAGIMRGHAGGEACWARTCGGSTCVIFFAWVAIKSS